jgi:glycosyltransferase involved in cell wall biosynthesis
MRPAVPANPLKVVCVGPTFRVGGVRQHALALAKFLNPERVQIKEFVVTEQAASAGRRDSRMPAPVTPASTSTIQRVSEASDILLMWGAGYNGRIPAGRAVRVFLAHGESWWTRNALEESSRVIDHVIAVSDQVRRSICNGFPTTTILNGVDTARLGQTAAREDLRRRFAFSEGDFVVGSIGRFTREKQFHLLIESLTRLPERFKLLLVGSGRRQAELLDFANRHIPGRFAMVSANDYLGDFYSAMDAFALVSAHEGFGLVLAEAMMCGRPVVSTRVGCASEVIHDRVNGLLVDHHPDSIASAFRLLQEHPHWAKGLAAEGHHFANTHLHAARMAREYEDLLLRLHGDRENRRRSGQ